MKGATSPLFRPTSNRASHDAPLNFVHNLLRDQITLPTWIAIGAAVQATLLLLPIRRYLAIAPAIIWILVQISSEALILSGLKRNTYASRALNTKYTAIFPARSPAAADAVETRTTPGGEPVSLFILGVSSNHPLGVLAPGFREIADINAEMSAELTRDAANTGFLGSTPFFNAADQTRNAGITSIYYFRSIHDVRRFAAGPIHAKAMSWWVGAHKRFPWLGIMHELYQVQAGAWENIYVNHKPVLFAATQHPIEDSDGKQVWASPIFDARSGTLSTTQGRLGPELKTT